VRLEVDAHGERIVARRLERFAENLTDARTSVWPRVVRILARATGRAFQAEASPMGEPWEALRPATIAAKQRKGQDLRKLRATRRLYASLLVDSHPDHIDQRDANELRWGTSVPYAGPHQGVRRTQARLPRRAFLGLGPEDRRALTKAVQAGLVRGE
jgi:phage virion morphogenesis protein